MVAAFFALLAGGGEQVLIILLFDALLGFEGEAAALVEVDAAERLGSVGIDKHHPTLEDVGVFIIVGDGRFGARDFEQVAQFAEE